MSVSEDRTPRAEHATHPCRRSDRALPVRLTGRGRPTYKPWALGAHPRGVRAGLRNTRPASIVHRRRGSRTQGARDEPTNLPADWRDGAVCRRPGRGPCRRSGPGRAGRPHHRARQRPRPPRRLGRSGRRRPPRDGGRGRPCERPPRAGHPRRRRDLPVAPVVVRPGRAHHRPLQPGRIRRHGAREPRVRLHAGGDPPSASPRPDSRSSPATRSSPTARSSMVLPRTCWSKSVPTRSACSV